MATTKPVDVLKMKKDLRHQVSQERVEFRRRNPGVDNMLSHHLVQGLKKIKTENSIWIGYVATESEADPRAAIEQIGGRWAFPKMVNKKLSFYLMDAKSTWVTGPFGVYEPDPTTSQQIDMRMAEGVLVPGVAFDYQGNRLGRGRAFYDKSLMMFPGHKVGIAYSVQIQSSELPYEEHDIRMNYIVTEEQFLATEGKK